MIFIVLYVMVITEMARVSFPSLVAPRNLLTHPTPAPTWNLLEDGGGQIFMP